MAGTAKAAKADKPKVTRKVLTIDERIAKAEAEAAELRDRKVKDAQAKRTAVVEKLGLAKNRLKEATTKVEDLERELEGIDAAIGTAGGVDSDEAPELKVV